MLQSRLFYFFKLFVLEAGWPDRYLLADSLPAVTPSHPVLGQGVCSVAAVTLRTQRHAVGLLVLIIFSCPGYTCSLFALCQEPLFAVMDQELSAWRLLG